MFCYENCFSSSRFGLYVLWFRTNCLAHFLHTHTRIKSRGNKRTPTLWLQTEQMLLCYNNMKRDDAHALAIINNNISSTFSRTNEDGKHLRRKKGAFCRMFRHGIQFTFLSASALSLSFSLSFGASHGKVFLPHLRLCECKKRGSFRSIYCINLNLIIVKLLKLINF